MRASRVSFTASSRRMAPTRGRGAKRVTSTTTGVGAVRGVISSSGPSSSVVRRVNADRRIAPAGCPPRGKKYWFPHVTLECRVHERAGFLRPSPQPQRLGTRRHQHRRVAVAASVLLTPNSAHAPARDVQTPGQDVRLLVGTPGTPGKTRRIGPLQPRAQLGLSLASLTAPGEPEALLQPLPPELLKI